MDRRLLLLGSAVVLLVAVAASASFAALGYKRQAEREQRRASHLQDRLDSEIGRYSQELKHALANAESVEPTGDLPASEIGLHRARIVGREGTYGLAFDWVGYSLDPHAPPFTNAVSQRQVLLPSPLVEVLVLERSPDVPYKLLRPIDLDDFFRSLDRKDATGTAYMDSEWSVAVAGPQFVRLIQVEQ